MKRNLIIIAAGMLSLAFITTANAQSIGDVKSACVATPMET